MRNVLLWIAQAILAALLTWAAVMKLFQSPAQLAAMWPWAAEVPVALVKFTGIVDLTGD
ncbi:DoxX family protein [Chitinophaga sedimenti]|uniref:DoxX family protein n=1 Tax=Chitinophaga sedimenti TaxID=2033606 RepID=UPI002003B03B|nr:DoxX family protein [Chitinophaga sedimenti]MCK7555936.1 DoxX family protein [Chitinophaga sedimenti]